MGEALVLRKEQRILVLLVLNQRSIKRPVGILGGETAKQHLPSAELRDGPRPRVLALKITWHCFTLAVLAIRRIML